MTNPDRGAYTPPTEPPLSFDARKPVRGRGPAPMMLIVSGLVLLILLGAIAVFYKSGQSQGSGPPPVVGSPIGQLKTAPPLAEQPANPAQGLQIYRQAEGKEQATPPKFTPPPEQPRARPTLSPLSQATGLALPGNAPQMPAKPVAAMPMTSPAPALKPSVTATAPAVKITPVPKIVVAPPGPKPLTAKAAPVPATKLIPPPAIKTAPAIVKTVAPPPVVRPLAAKALQPKAATPTPKPAASGPAVASGGASVQIGAFSSQALADKEWAAAVKTAPGKGKRVEAVPKNGGTLYRTTVTGFGSRADATAFCDKLKAAGKACFVK